MDIKESEILGGNEADHWYYRAKAQAMARLLSPAVPNRILDVGAGSGFFSKHLLRTTRAKSAICVDTGYEFDSESVESQKPIHFLRETGPVQADLTLMMDVLEHVDDDVGLLQEYGKKTPRKTLFLISVPAFQFMWSDHDVFLEHKRRYTLSQLEKVVRRAGFETEHGSYYYAAIFPLVAAMRLGGMMFRSREKNGRSQLQPHSPAARPSCRS